MKSFGKEDKNEKLLERLTKLESLPSTKADIEREKGEVLAKRRTAAAEIEELRKKQAELLPTLQKNLAEKEAAFIRAKGAMEAASDELKTAKHELSAESHNFEIGIDRGKQILFETAPEEIDAAIEFFQEKLGWLRGPGRISKESISGETNIFTMKKITVAGTNANAIRACLEYCMAKIVELQEMKLRPDLDADRIEALKKGIPSIDRYEEFTGERNLPKPPSTNERDYLPSDGQTDWNFKRLTKKVDKYLHPGRRA